MVRSQPGVQDVLVGITELTEDPTFWPFSDLVYILTTGDVEDVEQWTAELQPDAVEEGVTDGKPDCNVELKPGFRCYRVWWD